MMHRTSRHFSMPARRVRRLPATRSPLIPSLLRPLGSWRGLAPALAIVGVVALSGSAIAAVTTSSAPQSASCTTAPDITETTTTQDFSITCSAPKAAPVTVTATTTTTATATATVTKTVTAAPTATPAPTDPGVLPYWNAPSWRDEFDGTSLSTTKWNVHDNSSVSYDDSVSYASQATLSAGILRLRAERMAPITHGGKTRSWKSAHLTTVGKFTQRYGRWEMRAKIPNTSGDSAGLWPSFWLRDASGTGEVDIFEAWGTPTIKAAEDKYLNENVTSTIHQDTNGGKASTKFQWLPTQTTPAPTRLSGGFHTYVCEWTPDGFRFFLDGVKVGERLKANFPWFSTSFPGAVNMRIHFAVGQGYYGQPTAATKSPADYQIDYVRVYPYAG